MTNFASVFLPHVRARRFFNINFGFSYDPALEPPCSQLSKKRFQSAVRPIGAEIYVFEVYLQLEQNRTKIMDKLGLFGTKYGKPFIKVQFWNLRMTKL